MRLPPRLAAAALLATSALLLSGCVPPGPEVVPPPESTSSPLFASDEEALAAATDAYEAYLKVSDLIAQEGGANPERLAPFVSADLLVQESKTLETFAQEGTRQTGSTTFDNVALQQFDEDDQRAVVTIYVCLDFTGVDLIDVQGNAVTALDEKRWPFEATFERDHKLDNPLILIGHERWPSADFC